MKAFLRLANGEQFEGEHFGVSGVSVGEVVFNTSVAGYQELLTDPSYFGQIVNMTYPLIGNYGINKEDNESSKSWVKGFIVRELCEKPSNWRSRMTVNEFLKKQNVIGIQGIDTRHLTRVLRSNGVMNGVIWSEDCELPEDIDEQICAYRVEKAVATVTGTDHDTFEGDGYRLALLDFGVKHNIPASLNARGCHVDVYPAYTPAEKIISGGYDGIVLTNGPGDPEENTEIIAEIRKMIDSGIPMFGICLGHQLTALAAGFKTGKMKFGHRGGNQPVKDIARDRTYITSQNHGYAVLADSVDPEVAEISHVNLNDGSVEGLHYLKHPIFTVQFHPEGCAGPQDSQYLFDRFLNMVAEKKGEKNNAAE